MDKTADRILVIPAYIPDKPEPASREGKRYRVINPYYSLWYGFDMIIPAGSVGKWFEHGKCYTFEPAVIIRGRSYTPCVSAWAVEAWHEFFEEIITDE